jgi:hypothetical protein
MIFAVACTSKSDDTALAAAPTISFLAPEDGAVLSPGPIDVTLVVDGFTLTDPAKHSGEGEGLSGYIALTYDDQGTNLTENTGSTQASIDLNGTGPHTLTAELLYADGDALEPAVSASIDIDIEVGGT